MALIWRSIFEVDQESFVQDAPRHVQEWLRWKFDDKTFVLPGDASAFKHASGNEVVVRTAEDGELSAFRATLYEPGEPDEVRTTVIALDDGVRSWGWVDLERWSADAFVEPWVPIAPGIMTTILRAASCQCGPTQLGREIRIVHGQAGSDLAHQVLDPSRRLPVVVVSPNSRELDGRMAPTRERAVQINRRLVGIAPVVVLGRGAITSFSKVLNQELGEGFDVYGGAIRTYLPRVGPGDSPYVHRVVPFHRIRGRRVEFVADIIAAIIQRRACAQPPPDAWRDQLRPLLDPPSRPDDEIEDELLRLEQERDRERELRAGNEETLEGERETAAMTERENGNLKRRVIWLERELQGLGKRAPPTPVEKDAFEPDFCGEVPSQVAARLRHVVYPKSQWEPAEALDAHSSEAWAKRAWRAFTAMNAYAAAKATGEFAGNFREYCADGQVEAVPVGWVALAESETTDNNERFRELRTFSISRAVSGELKAYMPAHIKIAQGGYPAPRIHFHDDSGGPTGKVHIGYFGVHLDNKSKS